MSSKPKSLHQFRTQMLAWKSQGLGFGQIAGRLQAAGVVTNKGKVYRYFQKEGLATDDCAADDRQHDEIEGLFGSDVNQAVQRFVDRFSSDEDQAIELADEEAAPQTENTSALHDLSFPLPKPVAERFPQIDRARSVIMESLQTGLDADTIHTRITANPGVQATVNDVRDYIDGLLEELHPPGPIPPSLFEIAPTQPEWPNERPILKLNSSAGSDVWTVSDCARGFAGFGAPGTGKTTGSGVALARQFLDGGFGGIVFSTKQSDLDFWSHLVKTRKRENDFVIIQPRGLNRLNIFQYEVERPSADRDFTENFIAFMRNIVSAVAGFKGQRPEEKFWREAGDQLLRNSQKLILMAGESLTLDLMCDLISNAPQDLGQAQEDVYPTLRTFGGLMSKARKAIASRADLVTYERLGAYWLNSYPTLNPPTRSCITFSFGAMVDALRDRHIYEQLSTYTNITPEATFNGKIIFLNFPVNECFDAGLMVQSAWKYLFERAVLRRTDLRRGAGCRPVFLWEDEAHNYLIDFDPEFQRVCREYRACRVFLTQNINNLYERFGGGADARVKADSLLSNISTRIFHANGDHATNTWASEGFGTIERKKTDISRHPQTYHGLNPLMDALYRELKTPIVTTNIRTVREPIVHPHEFLTLSPGGKDHRFVSEAIVSQIGRTFNDGLPCRKMSFRQSFPGNPTPDPTIAKPRSRWSVLLRLLTRSF
ncbi:MAG: type IV secretory system conjugative DNA transfer family protein [Phycisphaerae bacterium]